jgi:hypothetical protein
LEEAVPEPQRNGGQTAASASLRQANGLLFGQLLLQAQFPVIGIEFQRHALLKYKQSPGTAGFLW